MAPPVTHPSITPPTTTPPPVPGRAMSLRLRLALGASLLAAGTIVTALILSSGLGEVARRLDAALAAETRMARYSTLSTQASTFLVVATESVQTGQSREIRMDRLAPVTQQMERTFVQLHSDVETAVAAARSLGLDAQSRYGTQSLGLARMQAALDGATRGLSGEDDTAALRAHLDSFAARFDPLLSQAVNTEVLFRNNVLAGIEDLRQRLTRIALAIAAATLLAVAAFYFGLIRPQFARLTNLRSAAHRIGQGDFTIHLPVTRADEIGQLAHETNRMAGALLTRHREVEAEWTRLNDTIAARTEELRAANAALAETDDKRRRFFADISHELRTPLTVILMEAQIGKTAHSGAQEAFATIEARAQRLNRRIDDLLRLARSDTGELALDVAEVSLPELVTEAAQEIEAEIDSAGMEMEITDIPSVTLHCDRNWVRQVIVSLIRNAIRHARAGGRLRLSARADARGAALSVTDNGPGVPPDAQARIFDRFAQGGSATAGEGFGVGLALAKWVIEAQDGEISLQSPLPRAEALGPAPGTKIAVRLPVKPR
ncbi:HAMP domain-containing sensor histidine kinase [uncultured Roseobacter sp.]|uniref:HAMP domain-containing sensor histidine kinase n=1 Tax=uncultured Roseobacter sp. TaxID=114847 RepID=UPI00262B025D|nr:HAMP domain-containing sensor histidine kinase [uncultured Roseobacter sp.]